MPTAYTSLLGLALPVSGDLTGTWGDTVNNAITSLLDTAVAGTTTLSADADVTLTDTTGAANQARAAVLRWTANGSITRSITAPARSKAYIVINDTAGTQSIVLRGAGPTTGVTIAAAERALVVWNGTDFTKVSSGGGSGAGSTTLISETFSGTGAQLIYTLANNPGLQANTQVYVGGVYQNKSTYTVVGTTLTFSEAPPSGTNNIEVMIVLATPVGFTDSASVTFLQSGAGAVTRTAQAKMRDVVSVKDFGAVGDGVTDDRAAIQAAFAASKSVYFPSGSYYLGAFSTADNIIDLSALGAGVSIKCDQNVEFVVQTTASVIPRVFYLLNNTNFSCDPIRIRDTGYDPLLIWKGAVGFFLDCGASDNWGDVKIDAIYGSSLVAPIIVAGGNASNRIRGIWIGQLFSDNCFYGFNAQNNGDGVAIDNLVAFQNYRPYFVYGCSDHKVKIFNRANRSTSGAVNISRSNGGLNTSGIDVTYVARDMAIGFTHVLINHIDLLGGEISNVRVNIDIRSSVIYTPLRFVNYTGSGGSETSAASSNLVYDVTIAGSCDVQASAVTSVASYAAKRRLKFQSGQHFNYDTTILNLFYLDEVGRPSSIAWTASVSPSIGNGSITNNVDVIDGVVYNNVSLTAGSTTTFGTGEWSFGLPFTSKSDAVGSAWIFDNGTGYYAGVVRILSGAAVAQVFPALNPAVIALSGAYPMTWANGDMLIFSLAYPIT